MKKVGIITITELDNFGNRLQNYALQETIKRRGYQTETIRNYITYKYRKSLSYQLKEVLRGFKYRAPSKISAILKMKRFDSFDKRYFKFSFMFSTIDYIPSELSSSYDFFVAGSDQIWNPYFTFNFELNFLRFTEKEKRLSYAASFGVEQVPKEKKDMFCKYLSEMHAVSVREYTGSTIVKSLIGNDVPTLLDPTMLLETKEWLEMERKPIWISKSKKYILAYYLGKTDVLNVYQNLCSQNDEYKQYELINVGEPNDILHYTIRPDEFLWLIHHSQLVMTDSFHGTVFSLLFAKPFIITQRKDTGESMNSRIETLFSKFHISNHQGVISQHIEENQHFVECLEYERNLANRYLDRILSGELL